MVKFTPWKTNGWNLRITYITWKGSMAIARHTHSSWLGSWPRKLSHSPFGWPGKIIFQTSIFWVTYSDFPVQWNELMLWKHPCVTSGNPKQTTVMTIHLQHPSGESLPDFFAWACFVYSVIPKCFMYLPTFAIKKKNIHVVKYTGWWFQPIWNTLVQLDHFPK